MFLGSPRNTAARIVDGTKETRTPLTVLVSPPTLTAVDRDGGSVYGDVSHILSPFNFAFSDFPFAINRTTGSVTLKNVVDFEAGQEEQIS